MSAWLAAPNDHLAAPANARCLAAYLTALPGGEPPPDTELLRGWLLDPASPPAVAERFELARSLACHCAMRGETDRLCPR